VGRGATTGAKKLSGRKRHLLVDTTGLLPLRVVVHPASVQDRDGAKLVLAAVDTRFPRIRQLWADQGYAGQVRTWISETLGWAVSIVQHPSQPQGRWVPHSTTGDFADWTTRSGSPTSACRWHTLAFAASCPGGGSWSARSPGSGATGA
jgi:hypothetical protein